MKHNRRTQTILMGTTLLAALATGLSLTGKVFASGAEDAPSPSSPKFYSTRVTDIFENNCVGCHDEGASGGLRLDSYSATMKGGDHGKVIVPGDPDTSRLILAIRRTGKLKMPPRKPLKPEDVADLEAWVKAGAVGSDETAPTPPAPASAPQTASAPAATPAKLVPVANVDTDFFENKIRPILANSCYDCHSDNPSAGLRVDSKEAFDKGGEHGKLIVAGDPDKSLLILAVRQTGKLKMPKGGRLREQEIVDLTAWVKAGAPWPANAAAISSSSTAKTGIVTDRQREFWSFQPLKVVPVPAIPDAKLARWAKTPIDHFIAQGYLKAGLAPSPVADRRALIRRATYDMTGLPPTNDEVEAFAADHSANAWEKVVDRLLASPRYGERWGRHWLDVARYAEDDVRGLDPKGRGYMPFNGAYRYRDWVIQALNRDLPYNQFLRMQMAGDKLPYKTLDERKANLTATSYLGAGPWVWDQAEPIQGRADERNERVDAVTRGLLGLTVACARCHNHKYDPVTQKDYYKVVSIFANSTYTEYPVVSDAERASYDRKDWKIAKMRSDLRDYTTAASRQLADALSIQSSAYMTAAWSVLGKQKKTVDEVAGQKQLDPQLLERWVAYLPKEHPYPYLNDWKAMMAAPESSEDQAKVIADAFQKLLLQVREKAADIEEQNDVIRAKNDVPKHRLKDAKPSEFETFDQFCPGCELELKALPTDEAKLYSDLFVAQSGDQDEKFQPGVMLFLGWDLKRRMGPQWQAYIDAKEKEIAGLQKELKEQPYPYVHGMADKPKIADIRLNVRGNPHTLGDVVPASFLTVLGPEKEKPYADGSGRIDFANDIANHPLAARVLVNRVWKWHFGTGIVDTPDNFGIMGDKPSNPALLEYLTAEFVHDGYSIKKLQREILLSAVYQTSVEELPAAHDKDAANRLYSHFSRQRLDAEELRDSALMVAGDLNLKKDSGPSVEFSPEATERTVFCKVSRYRLNNYLMVFDFPNPSFTSEQRFSSNVPLQQLYMMNNPFVYKQAGVLAERVHDEPADEARIRKVYEYVFQRKPSQAEVDLGLKFLATTPDKPGYSVNGEPITAWDEYARILLSSNEFQFVN